MCYKNTTVVVAPLVRWSEVMYRLKGNGRFALRCARDRNQRISVENTHPLNLNETTIWFERAGYQLYGTSMRKKNTRSYIYQEYKQIFIAISLDSQFSTLGHGSDMLEPQEIHVQGKRGVFLNA